MGYNTKYDTEYGADYFPSFQSPSYDTDRGYTSRQVVESTTTIHYYSHTTHTPAEPDKPMTLKGLLLFWFIILTIGLGPWIALLYFIS